MEKYFGVWRKHIPTNGLIFFIASEDWLTSREQRSVINAKKYEISQELLISSSFDAIMGKCPPPTEEEIEKCYGTKTNLADQKNEPKQEETKTE